MGLSPDAQDSITTFDGLRLHCEHFSAAGPTRAAVVMVHGFSSHCGIFREVAAAMAAAGFEVTGFDCRGHGRSQGRHGYVRRFADYGDDLHRVLEHARQRSPGIPVVVAAHSHGVTIALDYLLRGVGSFDALIAAAPYLALKMPVPLIKRAISPVVGVIWPTLTMSNQISPQLVTRNPAVWADIGKDPLVHHVATPRWFNEVRKVQARLRASAASLTVPTFMPVAGDDQLVDPDASIAFARAAGPTVEVRVYDDLFHEIYLEPERERVIADVVTWLSSRFGGASERDPYT